MRSINKIVLTGGLLLGVVFFPLRAQIPNSMYFLPGVPQSNRINPSIQPGCGFYIGFPALAPLRLQVSSSSLAFSDVIYPVEGYDSLVTPFHPLGDKEAFLNQLEDVNYFLSSFGTSLASIGFRAGKSFLSFDITTRIDGNIYYPKGIFEFIFGGAADGSEISLRGIGADITVFNEFSMGWSRRDFILPNLDIGFRGKALFGVANLTTANSVLDLNTSRDVWNLNAEMQYNMAGLSPLEFSADLTEGSPVTINDELLNSGPMEIVREVLSLQQFGLAADVGLKYRPVPQLLLSASVLDIGGIKWNNTLQGSFDFEYDFEGIAVNPITGVDTAFISELTDSLVNSLSIVSGEPYISRLNTKLFIGASYYPVEKIGFGILSRTDFLNERRSQQFTGSVNMTTGKFINLSLSYSYMSNAFNNIGAGFSFNVGPFNMYMISDNIISGAINPFDTRSVNLWFGMNLTFGWQKAVKKAKAVDKPLIL